MSVPKHYVQELKEAYGKLYAAVKNYGLWYIESNFKIPNTETREFLERIIKMLPEPEKASLLEIIAMGFEVTFGAYEFFYWIDESGEKAKSREKRAAYLLQQLTVDSKNPKVKPLVEDFGRAYGIIRDAWHNYGKLGPYLEQGTTL